ncbi:NADH dehydrogenase [ubiquinone] 1 alpha subcomplex subunit 10, mitochondrial [Ceratina calcarata]|uniref:NADH dehydrogenase [ubiquinone] 1 alpha subcomplex subunit 10, mitochondrial n=1 Tax=Ceratina calcarata TaxID=156304 RepID=A0AAJ7JHU1_9HYME|nr:NADH dehydrogenase [ubiquinone] 1 alpha subcomplex subunit 10, mitochondrial [Ceratina calcarata]
MTSIFCVSVKGNTIGSLTRLCKISNYNATQVAFMKRLVLKEELPKPPPFPYWRRLCCPTTMFTDPTSFRYDENTKLIIVDGPPAAGKTKLCEKLAEEFGLLYMPPPTHDQMFVNPYGFDLRSLDPKLPAGCKSCDLNRFLTDPTNKQVPIFQMTYLYMRLEQYMNALVHILASGQGVVLNRSAFSDVAFVDAMYNAGYLSKAVVDELEEMKRRCMYHLLRPHLVIYLDVPPEVTIDNVKRRAIREEVNSKVINTNYLSDLDRVMKEKVLSSLTSTSEVLIYDWSKDGNPLDIVHDIEHTDLEEVPDREKFQDWIFIDAETMIMRLCLFHEKETIFNEMNAPMDKMATELYTTAEDDEIEHKVMEGVVSEKYEYGWNPELGDKYSWRKKFRIFKLSLFRRTPLDFVNCKFFDYKAYP